MNHDHLFEQAVEMLEAARPTSGFRPETTEEWIKVRRAVEELMFASLVYSGKSGAEARVLSRLAICSPIGAALIDTAFSEAAHVRKEK
jgi:hypothetical protein